MGPKAETIRVLMVDDNEDDVEIIREMLSSVGNPVFKVEWRATSQAALDSLKTSPPDICLVDYRLGSESGLDLVKRAGEDGRQTPLILLTGQGDHELDLKAMQMGAADFISKNNVDPVLLERSIRYAIERKRSEEKLLKREEQLRQAQKMEAVGRLAGGVAHDFNNLLMVIRGNCEFLLETKGISKECRKDLEDIKEAAMRGSELTRQLLVFGRKQMFQPVPLGLNRIVADMNKMLSRIVGEKIHLEFRPQDPLELVLADPIQIQQLLMNLILNARDAMPEGGEILLRTANLSLEADCPLRGGLTIPAGSYVQLSVTDTGKGMDEEIQKHLFEPFFTTKPTGLGTGLGLSTVYGIVQDLKGTILLDSKPGFGTTFKILIPAILCAAENLPQGPSAGPSLGGTGTILLVEDEASVRRILARTLRQGGYEVLEAGDGLDALRKIKENPGIDLLLTDTIMPQMNGLELMEQAKKVRPALKAVFMSGYPMEALSHQMAMPADTPLILKPFSWDQLGAKIRETMGKNL